MSKQQELARLLVFNLATDADDPLLGFTTDWLRALAGRVEHVDVVTMRAGRLTLPANVEIYSIGKERGFSEPRRAVEFYRVLWRLIRAGSYDACFAHMTPLFTVMGAPLLRRKHIPITMWHAHRATPLTLRLAKRVATKVVTSTDVGRSVRGPKVRAIGQGIDTDRFRPLREQENRSDVYTIIAIGRIAPIKRIDLMVEALAKLKQSLQDVRIQLLLVGPVAENDRPYAEAIERRSHELGISASVELLGPIPRAELPELLSRSDVAINLSPPGSFDKSALEAMACALPLVTTNPALGHIVAEVCDRLHVASSAWVIACALVELYNRGDEGRLAIGSTLRSLVMRDHSLQHLIDSLLPLLAAQ